MKAPPDNRVDLVTFEALFKAVLKVYRAAEKESLLRGHGEGLNLACSLQQSLERKEGDHAKEEVSRYQARDASILAIPPGRAVQRPCCALGSGFHHARR